MVEKIKHSLELNENSRVLLIRMDRIGDLVMTLPVDESLPTQNVQWWIPPGISFVTKAAQPARRAKEVSKKISFSDFRALLNEVKLQRFDASIVFHAPWWVSLLLFMAKIPLRAGNRSQWHSFLFLNRGVRQKRSLAEASELEYNFRLVEAALGKTQDELQRRSLKIQGMDLDTSAALLKSFGLIGRTYSVVHPGMGGSALNWPTERYVDYIKLLTERGKVVITGTKSDEVFLAPIRKALGKNEYVIWLDQRLNGLELITVLENARSVTAPSTGVMHLAASTGRPTLGIFSPVRVQKPTRWGPQGERVATIMPKVECPGTLSCLGEACPHFDCMKLISASEALNQLDQLTAH